MLTAKSLIYFFFFGAMKIIILGAGQVGGTLAEHLANEQNDITVVDTDGDKLRALQDRLDIGSVQGGASHPNTLYKAGAEDADMLIAVTNSDKINPTIRRYSCNIGNIESISFILFYFAACEVYRQLGKLLSYFRSRYCRQ